MGPCEVPSPKVIVAMVLSRNGLSRVLSPRDSQPREQPPGVLFEDVAAVFIAERLDRVDQRFNIVEWLPGFRIGSRSRARVLGSEHHVPAARDPQQQLERL